MKRGSIIKCEKCLKSDKKDFNWYCIGRMFSIGVMGLGVHIFIKYAPDSNGKYFAIRPNELTCRCRIDNRETLRDIQKCCDNYISEPSTQELLEI